MMRVLGRFLRLQSIDITVPRERNPSDVLSMLSEEHVGRVYMYQYILEDAR
ncbi:hypothetical protein FRB95_007053 [Tulasnella sp. JGI-2019a]|nr:hypothetical protein FRB95_007053 [Tulasnella sp. JGI-2019a]